MQGYLKKNINKIYKGCKNLESHLSFLSVFFSWQTTSKMNKNLDSGDVAGLS